MEALINTDEASFYYCDPPYKNTAGYKGGFDYERFESWINTVEKPCIISEYTCPKGCVEIGQKEKRILFSRGSIPKEKNAIEKLFIQEKYFEWYQNEMKKITAK